MYTHCIYKNIYIYIYIYWGPQASRQAQKLPRPFPGLPPKIFPESFSEAGFSFRFRGPGVGARPRDAEPSTNLFLCAGCEVRAFRMALVQARVVLRDFWSVKLIWFDIFFVNWRRVTSPSDYSLFWISPSFFPCKNAIEMCVARLKRESQSTPAQKH